MEPTVHVRVLLFASHREVFGESRFQLSVPSGTDIEALFGELVTLVPRMADLRSFTTFAVNREVVAPSTILRDGDELALLQPVSGGCGD
jgi:molybdopterin converting factor small subunit